MKKIILSLIIPGITLLAACAPLKVDQMPPRTPRDFLLDIKAVADSDDLTKVDFVGRRLRIDLVPGPEKPAYGTDGQTLLGYGVDVEKKGATREYRSENFNYGIFRPKGRDFERVLISISVNPDAICVTPADLMEVFREARRYPNPHTSAIGYVYENLKEEGVETYFRFEGFGCLYKFGFSKNTKNE